MAKFNADKADVALQWIVRVLQSSGDSEDQQLASEIGKVKTEKDVHTPLKTGVILCHLVNIIVPGSVKKIDTSDISFMQIANIGKFLDACDGLGLIKADTFRAVDLFDSGNIAQVIEGITQLGKMSGEIRKGLPELLEGEAANPPYMTRESTGRQKPAGEGGLGLELGTNKFN